jgi:hypothetical protein
MGAKGGGAPCGCRARRTCPTRARAGPRGSCATRPCGGYGACCACYAGRRRSGPPAPTPVSAFCVVTVSALTCCSTCPGRPAGGGESGGAPGSRPALTELRTHISTVRAQASGRTTHSAIWLSGPVSPSTTRSTFSRNSATAILFTRQYSASPPAARLRKRWTSSCATSRGGAARTTAQMISGSSTSPDAAVGARSGGREIVSSGEPPRGCSAAGETTAEGDVGLSSWLSSSSSAGVSCAGTAAAVCWIADSSLLVTPSFALHHRAANHPSYLLKYSMRPNIHMSRT